MLTECGSYSVKAQVSIPDCLKAPNPVHDGLHARRVPSHTLGQAQLLKAARNRTSEHPIHQHGVAKQRECAGHNANTVSKEMGLGDIPGVRP